MLTEIDTKHLDPRIYLVLSTALVTNKYPLFLIASKEHFARMAESIETRRENWLRVIWGLLCVREGLQVYVDTKGKRQYQTFINNVNTKCNNQTCDQCQINNKCPNSRANNPSWMNTDSTKWHDPHVGYWEVAKCYLSTPGYLDKTRPNQVDASGLLSICINSLFIKQHIKTIHHFEEVRNIRNKTLHDPNYEMDGQTADDCLDKIIKVLEDPQELIHDTFAKQAANHIRKMKVKTKNTPPNMTEALQKRLRINFDVDKLLKEIEGLLYAKLQKDLKAD
ncbi:hypothetical protein MAR_002991, partial [Mya arenaria]